MFLILKALNRLFYRPWIGRKLAYCGKNVRIGYMTEIICPEYFSIGDNFYCGPFSFFGTNGNAPVFIGKNVMFGPRCIIQGGNHDMSYLGFMINGKESKDLTPITIEDGVWLGCDVTIISRANIGEGSIIGAKSLINKKIPPYVIAAGIPARVIKPRFSSKKQLAVTLSRTKSKYILEELIALHSEFGFTYD